MSFSGLKKKIREFLFGFFVMEPLLAAGKIRFKLELSFMSAVVGDLIGIPLFSPIYKLKLLPHWFPLITVWKNNILKEEDLTDKIRG